MITQRSPFPRKRGGCCWVGQPRAVFPWGEGWHLESFSSCCTPVTKLVFFLLQWLPDSPWGKAGPLQSLSQVWAPAQVSTLRTVFPTREGDLGMFTVSLAPQLVLRSVCLLLDAQVVSLPPGTSAYGATSLHTPKGSFDLSVDIYFVVKKRGR